MPHGRGAALGASANGRDTVWQVTQKDGDEASLTLIEKGGTLDNQPCELLGLVGKVRYGYKLFPVRRIRAIHFDTSDEPKEKDEKKDKRKLDI